MELAASTEAERAENHAERERLKIRNCAVLDSLRFKALAAEQLGGCILELSS
jgi:hypothetical protein